MPTYVGQQFATVPNFVVVLACNVNTEEEMRAVLKTGCRYQEDVPYYLCPEGPAWADSRNFRSKLADSIASEVAARNAERVFVVIHKDDHGHMWRQLQLIVDLCHKIDSAVPISVVVTFSAKLWKAKLFLVLAAICSWNLMNVNVLTYKEFQRTYSHERGVTA